MLEALRRHASGWIAKILIGLLILSFGFWGITEWLQEMVTGRYSGAVATVGNAEIQASEFQQAYRTQIDALTQQAGQRLTPEQARMFGVDQGVLRQLINTAAIDNHAKELGLALPDKAVAENVENDPAFRGPDGKFSHAHLEAALRRAGLSEAAYIELRRREDLRKAILNALSEAVTVPRPLTNFIYAYRNETRTLAVLTIDGNRAVKIDPPNEAKLRETYETNKPRFMTPEYRRLAILLLRPEEVRARFSVGEDEIKAVYEKDKESYNIPERRHIEQIAFKDRPAAEAARQAISAGKTFADAAKEQGASASDIDLGLLARRDLIDPKIAEAAFALNKDEVSGVTEGKFGFFLLRVTAIEPGKERTLDDVRGEIRERLLQEKVKAEIEKLYNEVAEARDNGASLEDIAKRLSLRFVDVPALSRSKETPDGKQALDVSPDEAEIIAEAGFAATPGFDNEAVELPSGGYAWVNALSSAPPQTQPFEAVQEKVKTLYTENERRRQLSDLGNKLAERLNKGETLEKIAAEFGGTPETVGPVKRSANLEGKLSQAALDRAFGLRQGEAASSPSADARSRTLIKVLEVKPAPPPSEDESARLRDELAEELRNDTLSAYVDALRRKQGVYINDALFRRATGDENAS